MASRFALDGTLNMIGNDRQYRGTRALVRKIKDTLAHLPELAPDLGPDLQQLVAGGYERKLSELLLQMDRYEALRRGEVDSIMVTGLSDVGDALIAARVARHWTQADLARRLGLKPQQIQRYENTEYGSASLDRVALVADALGVKIDLTVTFGGAAPEDKTGSEAAGQEVAEPAPAAAR